MMRQYKHFTIETLNYSLFDLLVDVETLADSGDTLDFVPPHLHDGDLTDNGVVEMDGPSVDVLPDYFESGA